MVIQNSSKAKKKHSRWSIRTRKRGMPTRQTNSDGRMVVSAQLTLVSIVECHSCYHSNHIHKSVLICFVSEIRLSETSALQQRPSSRSPTIMSWCSCRRTQRFHGLANTLRAVDFRVVQSCCLAGRAAGTQLTFACVEHTHKLWRHTLSTHWLTEHTHEHVEESSHTPSTHEIITRDTYFSQLPTL